MSIRSGINTQRNFIYARLDTMADIAAICLTNTTVIHIKIVRYTKIIIGTVSHIEIVTIAKSTLITT